VTTFEVSKKPTIIKEVVKEQPIVQNPVENTYNLYYENKTIQNINQEYLIKGDREMICIASPESPDKMICYKQR
jgi:hypothetical protein